MGKMYAIVGNTGSGKSRFVKDIEQLCVGDSPTRRKVLVDGRELDYAERSAFERSSIAHLGQNMRFVLDVTVEQFVAMHARCRGKAARVDDVVALANEITPERVLKESKLNLLSGGQSRALMTADVALVCDSPVVLVDEIENAGIDKAVALSALCGAEKLVLAVTHDPHTALMAHERIVMKEGSVACVRARSPREREAYRALDEQYRRRARCSALCARARRSHDVHAYGRSIGAISALCTISRRSISLGRASVWRIKASIFV